MKASNLRPESAILSPRHSLTQERKPGSLSISHQDLQSYLYGREKVDLIDQNERKGKWTNTAGTSLSGDSSPSKRRPSSDSHDLQSTYAVRSFPAEVQLCTSSIPGAEYGVCAKQHIPSGTWIGPFEGKRVRPTDLTLDVDTDYIWEVYENGHLSFYLDGNDENSSSWMRFIRCARHPGEQNMYAFQFCGSVFYRAFRDISIGTEMLVWYDVQYPQFMGIPLGLKDIQLISSLGGIQNGCHRQNTIGVPVLSMNRKDEGPVHHPRFSPVEMLAEDADGNISVSQTSAVVPDDIKDMQRSPPAPLTVHSFQQQQQEQQQQQQQLQHRHQQKKHIQYPYKLHHLPNKQSQQQPNNHPNNFQQQQLQPQQVYNHQQQQQEQQHQHRRQHHHQLPQQHLHQHQLKQQHQHRQRQHGHCGPESSFFSSDCAKHLDRKSPGSPPTVPPLRSISQHTQSQQHTPFWTHRDPRHPGPYQGDTPVMRLPDFRPALTDTNPRAVLSHIPLSVVNSSPNQHPRSMPPHPLKSAHVKPFHINTGSLTETTTKETSKSGDESIRKSFAPTETLVRGHQERDGVHSGEKEILARQENASANETRPNKWMEENDEVDMIEINNSLEKHLNTWKCKQCPKIFTHRVSLTMHVCSHQPKKPFQCGHCPSSFSTPLELRDHVDTHGSEKSFKCGFCARSFAGPTTLNNHMRMHTGEKPFNCGQCGKTFIQATNLARHQRNQGQCAD